MPASILLAGSYLLLATTLTYVLFGHDKRQAKVGGRRISEANLLFWAMIGGSLGAKLGQSHFRHKTRKQPFAQILNLIIAAQILGGFGAAAFLMTRGL